jgi:hypothetical protein
MSAQSVCAHRVGEGLEAVRCAGDEFRVEHARAVAAQRLSSASINALHSP